jgi:hypothetical protein
MTKDINRALVGAARKAGSSKGGAVERRVRNQTGIDVSRKCRAEMG